jgi:hypothetical protein
MPAVPQQSIPGKDLQKSTKYPGAANAQGERSPPNEFFWSSTLSPVHRIGTRAAPPHPPPPRTSRGEGVAAKRCGEAGSAPIWRAAVAGKRGRRELRLVSRPPASFPSFPALPGAGRRLEGHWDPHSRWGSQGRKGS